MRNTVGFDFHPKTKELWFTDNQRDWLSEDFPLDELNRLKNPGKDHFGYPYCHSGTMADPEFGWGKSCADYVKPAALLGAARGSARHALLHRQDVPREVSRRHLHRAPRALEPHARSTPTCRSPTSTPTSQVTKVEPFLTGFVKDNQYLGRPVDLLTLPDGSLLVSDDHAGAVYRVSYGR